MLTGAAAQMIASPIAGYIAWANTTLLIYVTLSLLGSLIGQNWWTPMGRVWVRWGLLGPPYAVYWILRNVVGGIWGSFFPKGKKNSKKGGTSYTFNVTIFGGNGQNQRRRRGGRRP